ncbi:MAG: valine--tRNA ligase [Bacteroidota bacterium]
MTLTTRYNAAATEEKWYAHWMDKKYFASQPDDREPFTIVIPPPNVTGVLHMGHMLDNTIQDILIRKARMDGKNACWVPGTDHASIATEAKVVRKLREQGIKKGDLTRAEFLQHAWDWKEEYGGKILLQLRKLGASCDWDRTAFTMDDIRSKQVIEVFVDLYNKGKLYRGLRMVNWDPQAQTVLSNEEVIHGDEDSFLYHLKYKIDHNGETSSELNRLQRKIKKLEQAIAQAKPTMKRGTYARSYLRSLSYDLAKAKQEYAEKEDAYNWLTIATKRPETIMGDTAIAVHPDDPRYTHLRGKRAIVPLINRSIPIIFDDYVEMDFGTGALKVTPAHDPNDYEIGLRHNLEVIDTIADDGKLNEKAQIHIGKDRFEARDLVKADLEAAGHLFRLEPYHGSVGRSERTGAVIEPKLSLQWYVDMKKIADPALKAVMSDEVEFFPKKYKNTYRHWMENIRDWCISRQLWWGHQIPAWYYEGETFVATDAAGALKLAQAKFGDQVTLADLKQDEDVLDTWFSSWLWPFSVFDGKESGGEVDYYYPTSVLVTGWDIIFLWVARMIMSGYEWKGTFPFKDVYLHGMVRDKQGRKMSKSLGNSPDALGLIEEFGADGVRFGMMSCAPAGGDLLFDKKLCAQGAEFCNKMWNALRLVKGWEIAEQPVSEDLAKVNALAADWFTQKFSAVLKEVDSNFTEYRLSEITMDLYNFIWNDFFSGYLEFIKPPYGSPIDRKTYDQAIGFFSQMMTVLHPIMPFVTEEIWHQLKDRANGEDCIMSQYPKAGAIDAPFLKDFEAIQGTITQIRKIRQKNNLKSYEPLKAFIQNSESAKAFFGIAGVKELLQKMASLERIDFTDTEPANTVCFASGTERFFLELNLTIDVAAEKARIGKELDYMQGFLKSVEKKLGNERFVNNAPAKVVENERNKQADAVAKIAILEESLAKLN